MFNHSSRPNIDYRVNTDQLMISFRAARDIEQGAIRSTVLDMPRICSYLEPADAAAAGK